MRIVKRIGLGLLGLIAIVLIGLMTWEPFAASPSAPPPTRAYAATITRDEFGVPHIHGRTDPDVAFGIAWAHSEDDFATLQDVLAMTRGRFGAIAGEKGAAVDYAYHLLLPRTVAERRYASLPEATRKLLEAYASGLNLYAARHPGEIKLARLFPVNGPDIATGFALRQPFFFGLDNAIGPLVKGEPVRRDHGPILTGARAPDYAAGGGDTILAEETERSGGTALPLPVGEDGALAGSNAFAIAPGKSDDRTTRLVSNAHQPYWGGVAWYELVVESDQGWHMAGAMFPGMPFVALGHNETLGWTNTVNRPDLIDIYKLKLDDTGERYMVDGKWRPLASRRVWLPVRFGPLVLPVPRTVHAAAQGPVVVNDNGAFAIRWAGMGSIDSIDAFYHLNKARTYAEWETLMRRHPLPSTNYLYADKAGNIAYIYNAAFPKRTTGADWRSILPGDRSDLIWQGYAPFEAQPRYLNPASGYLYNANNTPFRAAGASDLAPASADPLLGVELDVTNRTRRADKLLAEPGPISRARLHAIKYDTGYENAGYVKWMLDAVAALDLRDEPELQKAQRLLATWDFTADGKGGADALANMVLQEGMATSYQLKPAPDPRAELKKAADHLTRHFGRLDPPYGDVFRIRQGKVDLPNDGGGDTLRASTSWIKTAKDGRFPIKHGDSFVMFVEWPANGPVTSRSIQPFGAATTRPDSPHYADQAPLFVAHRTKPVHFTRAQIAAHAVRRYTIRN